MRARDAQGRFAKESGSLTAAITTVPSRALDNLPRNAQAWQEQAWRLWRILGVLHYPTTFMAEQIMRLDWDVEIDGNQLEPEQAAVVMDAIAEGIGVDEASRRLALNFEVAGEVFYIRKQSLWQVVSRSVPKFKEKIEGADITVHGMLSDPVEPDKPDSAVRAALDVAEEIRVLSGLARAQTRSRLAQRGILLVPKESQFAEGDDFQAKLEEAMTAPISDEYAPSAVVPLKVDAPGDTIDKWKHLVMESPYDERLQERIDNAIKRLALSLNMPPEVLLGNMDANHWNAWLSEESTYRAHVEPLALLVGETFAEAMRNVTGNETILVRPDPAELLARRSSVEDAFRALELGVVGFEYVRRAMGADDEDAPTPEELQIVAVLTRKADQSGIPGVEVQAAPALPQGRANANGNGVGVQAAVSDDKQALDALGDRLADIDQHLLIRLQGAADMTATSTRARLEDVSEVARSEVISTEVDRLAATWRRLAKQGRQALIDLGINAKGPEWAEAYDHSEVVLSEGMTDWLTENMDKPESDMAALPIDLMRQVLAAAGGSDTAVVAALTRPRGILPQPTPADPQSFATGVLTTKELKDQGIGFTQWRFRYGAALRSHPFIDHQQQNGRFTDVDGVVAGWYPGDHKGCLCELSPVYGREVVPEGEDEESEE